VFLADVLPELGGVGVFTWPRGASLARILLRQMDFAPLKHRLIKLLPVHHQFVSCLHLVIEFESPQCRPERPRIIVLLLDVRSYIVACRANPTLDMALGTEEIDGG